LLTGRNDGRTRVLAGRESRRLDERSLAGRGHAIELATGTLHEKMKPADIETETRRTNA
jgi:hypothetical protein